jgi:hypothetical protein
MTGAELRMRRLLPLASASRERSAGDDTDELPHGELLDWELTAMSIVYPFRGRTQAQ